MFRINFKKRIIMNKIILMLATLSISTFAFADNHANSSEDQVLKALSAYMDARQSQDYKTVVAMSSKHGTFDTNSDGSFHKPLTKQTVASWANSGDGVTKHFYPEATAISDDVVFVRFYSEGMVGSKGKMSDYRTRVTMTWVKEDSTWVLRSSHYSAASFGGVHKTLATDFED